MEFFRSFKDEYNVYFLTEYIKGVELFDVIRNLGKNPSIFLKTKDFYKEETVNFM